MPHRHELEATFLAELDRIDRIVAALCRRHGLEEENEDVASWLKLRLIEDDYAILAKFRGESTLATYLTVVLARLVKDYRVQQWGRWRPSAAARRRGPLAIRLETLVYRDGQSLAHVAEQLRIAGHTTLSDRGLAALLASLPVRWPARPSAGGERALSGLSGEECPETELRRKQMEIERTAIVAAVDDAMRELPPEDRAIVRLHYWEGLTLAEVARALGLAQKPLYRRLERLRERLRGLLQATGLSAEQVRALLNDGDDDGPSVEETARPRPSMV